MFWITGGEEVLHVLAKSTGWVAALFLAEQFTHVAWNGFRPYDLIFPLFIFLSGVSTPFALGSRLEKGTPPGQLVSKVIRRGLILVLLGIIYNNGIFQTEWASMRYPSVLGRIGLAGMFAQLIYLYSSTRSQWIWLGGLLLGYWLFLLYVPVPGCGAGLMTMECNPASYLDRTLLPGRLHKVIHDPEGLLSTLPAIGTALFGIMAGNLLRSARYTMPQKVGYLFGAGLACVLLGALWGMVLPINKNLWTSSFTVYVAGWSLLLLAVFYGTIDLLGWRRWAFFFVVIGTNSIVVYMASSFIDFDYTAKALFGGLLGFLPEAGRQVGIVVAYIAVQWVLLYVLYRNKWFLKV
jgi:predicted acyltransferase